MRIILLFIIFLSINSFASETLNVDSLLQDIENKPDTIQKIHYKKIHSYYAHTAIDSAIFYAKQGLNTALKSNNSIFIVDMYIRLASSYIDISDLTNAQLYSIEALKLAEKSEYNKAIPIICNNLGIVYASNKDYKLALQYYNKAVKVDSVLNDWVGFAIDLSNLTEILVKNKEYKKAQANYEIAYNIYDSLGIDQLKPAILNNLGELQFQQAKYDSAIYYFKKTVDLKVGLGLESSLPPSYNNLGIAYLRKNQLANSKKYLEKAYSIAHEKGLLMQEQIAAQGFVEYYKKTNNFEKALDYCDISKVLGDSIFSIEKEKQKSELNIKYQVEKKEKEIQILKQDALINEQEASIQKQQKIAAIIGAGVFLILLVMSVNRLKLRKKLFQQKEERLKAEVKYKEEESLRKEEELRATAEMNKLIAEKAQEELEFKNREITSSALYVAQKNEILCKIDEQLSGIKEKTKGDQHKDINQLKKLIKENIELDEDWNNFKLHFEQVHPQFFERIIEISPELTANEQKVCAYIRMNLAGKEIARLLNITPKSAQMSRYRLKKKFNLAPEEDLYDFISGIA